MIKLISAHVKNFRQLRDCSLSFARDEESPLTVIRAENATGKTTLLTALTWALFGDDGLHGRRSGYRLHSLDWDNAVDGNTCETQVSIKFAAIDDESGMERTYELVRTSTERPSPDGSFTVENDNLMLFERKSTGDEPVTNPTAFITNRVLPKSLKDVFFIDGDRALAFIEATDERSAKRDRVEQAVRQLLGLDLLEDAERHVDSTRRQAVSELRKLAKGTNLEQLAKREVELDEKKAELLERKAEIEEDRQATDRRKRKADEAMREALAAGGADRKELERQLSNRDGDLKAERKLHSQLVGRQRDLVNSSQLLVSLTSTAVTEAGELLSGLEEQGVIPDTLPEVVKDRIHRGICICGRDVSQGSDGHEALCELLEEVDQLEGSHEILVHLSAAHRLRQQTSEDDDSQSWGNRAKNSGADILRCEQTQARLEKEIGELRAKVSGIKEQDISELERMLTEEEQEAKRLTSEAATIAEQIRSATAQVSALKKDRQAAQKKEDKYRTVLAQETAANDLLAVLRSTVQTLESETVDEVSNQMSDIFLKMIVADPDSGGMISGAELTRDHDITVLGPDSQRLDPDKDLSGAQRRALTLAFILALVQVSGVRAPNVVDTPLGMTSELVRRALLEYAAENSSQLVMFLTGSEVVGVEDILDRFAGMTYTLTFTDHYPMQLVNDPGSGRKEVLICDCDYYSHCNVCERKATA